MPISQKFPSEPAILAIRFDPELDVVLVRIFHPLFPKAGTKKELSFAGGIDTSRIRPRSKAPAPWSKFSTPINFEDAGMNVALATLAGRKPPDVIWLR